MAMRVSRLSPLAVLGAAALLLAGLKATSGAKEQPVAEKSERGGLLTKTGGYQFEVFFYPSGVRVFPQGTAGAEVDLSKVTGTATFYHPTSVNPWFTRPLHVMAPAAGQHDGSLDLAIGLRNAPASGVNVSFEVSGLPGTRTAETTFVVPLEFAPTPATPSPTVVQPTPPPAGIPAVPRYDYRPGPSGYGYYEHTSPAAAASTEVLVAPSPRYSYSEDGSGAGRDWSTGRSVMMAKPWMRP